MFVVYINDMTEWINSYMSLFADDAKLLMRVKTEEDCDELESVLDRECRWSQTWAMQFNSSKCHYVDWEK